MRNTMQTAGVVLCVSLSMGIYAGDWPAHSIDREGRGADGIRISDVNGDGLFDIATGWEEAGETRIYLHPGHAAVREFWPKVKVGDSGRPEDAVFSDLDRDGFTDVVSCSENKAIFIHWAPSEAVKYLSEKAWNTGILPCSKGFQKWMIAVPVQVDGKNGPDLICAGKSTQVVWLESPENPRNLSEWQMHVISNAGGWTMGLSAVDIDRDGDRDALLGVRRPEQNAGTKWLENPGAGPKQKELWEVHEVGPRGEAAGFVEMTDLDGDGLRDVIVPAMDRKCVMIHRGINLSATEWQTIEIALPKSRNKGIAVGDIDLDGQDDIALTHEFGDAVWLSHDGEIVAGHWTYHHVAEGRKLDDVQLYDADGDGDLDMFTTDERGLQVVWYENPVADGAD